MICLLISENDRIQIKESAFFLKRNDFSISEDEDTIIFTNGKIDIIVSYEKYETISSLYIRFNRQNKVFNIAWIAFVQDGLRSNSNNRLQTILFLMQYLYQHYNKIIEYSYCVESEKLIEQFIKEKQNSKR